MELWKPISGYEGRYEISSYGRVKRLQLKVGYRTLKEKILKPELDTHGYHRSNLTLNKKQKHFLTHRLVATAFLPPVTGKYTVNHIDANRINNRIENLEWADSLDQSIHSVKLGRQSYIGQANANAKLTDAQVIEIRERLKTEVPKKIAHEYGVSWALLYFIKRRRNWTHL